MNTWTKRLEVAVNVAVLCAFIMVAALAGQRLWSAHFEGRDSGPRVGSKLSLAGMDWSKSERSLVLALSTTCHFCTESADFYRQLIPDAAGRGVPVIAVLPQAPSESQSYLNSLGVPMPHIFQGSLGPAGIGMTPTLLIVDRKGAVRKFWVGKLDSQQQSQVTASLQ
jgi:hypothetical protein